MTFVDEATEILPELVALRRLLHGAPEVGLVLPETQAAVLDALDGLELEITLGSGTTSVTAVLRGARPGPTVLLRGDMDALPVVELTGLEYASTNQNMHACGHDLHVAGLVGAARLLAARRQSLAGNVVFMFQPGEEGDGGAKVMLDEGLLDASGEKPAAAYAIHVVPGPRGVFTTRPGTIMAGANELQVIVHGAGGHGSKPQMSRDPVPVVAELVTALQTYVTRRFDVFDPIVLTVTQLAAGAASNVIPDRASLGATVRTLSAATHAQLREELPDFVESIAAAHGCTATTTFITQYPVTVNHAVETEAAISHLRGVFGENRVQRAEQPVMGSEDFSFVLQEVPGTFIFLMASPPEVDPATAEYNHSPRVLFDDEVLADQAAALAELAWSHLGSDR
ncbi:M20 family metallopeptidase [Homoserinimonas sp. OAct 916]|uniref:M20 metallopeptidase family protein n=1 Tax=Homoserinimonas sp. OAct 916 TaxID=2211450 RepID=UPI000DBE01D4|nr:M20 family metallopeptidase [Homoserinimonas sp. OAct 916]